MRQHATCACVVLLSSSLALAELTPLTPTDIGDATPVTSLNPSASGTTPSGNSTCHFSGDVTHYLECKKDKVSTTTLIAAALGVTVGILALVGLCVFMCHRSRKRRAVPNATQKAAQEARAWREKDLADKVEEYLYPEDKRPPLPFKGRMTRSPTVYDGSDEDLLEKNIVFTKPARHQAPNQIIVGPRHPDSPVEMANGRVLYPSNPSPAPRHLRESVARPPSTYQPGREASAYQPGSRRPYRTDPPEYDGPPPAVPEKSKTKPTVHSRATFGAAPKTPVSAKPKQTGEIAYTGRPQSQGGTKPLNIRKSSAPSVYGRPRPPPEGPPPALPHSELLPAVPAASVNKPAIPQSATIPVEDPLSPKTMPPPPPAGIKTSQESAPARPSPPSSRRLDPPAEPQDSTPLREQSPPTSNPVQAPFEPEAFTVARQSVMQSYAIPSYYETSPQTVYDPTKSRAPSTYIPRSRSGSVDVLPEIPQAQSAPEQAPAPVQPLAPLKRPSVPNFRPQSRTAPDRSHATLARPMSRVQRRSMYGRSVSIDPFTQEAMRPPVPPSSTVSPAKPGRKPSQVSQTGPVLSDSASSKVGLGPSTSRQQSSSSTNSVTSSTRPLLVRDESGNTKGDEFVDAVETLDGDPVEEGEGRAKSRLGAPDSESDGSARKKLSRSPSVDRGGLI